jgi:TDG/mug DNA glycosylase family protein
MGRVPDVIAERPRILFVGINPGETSGKVGHHFAGPGNPFWRLLHAAGLTPVELSAEEDQRLVEFGYALVNLCTRTTKTAAELTREEMARGAAQLRAKIRSLQPQIVALVGVTLYPILVREPRVRGAPKQVLTPGAGLKPERVEGARLFVVPNPSGLNASFPSFEHKLVWFRQLAALVGAGKPASTSK